MKKLIAPFIAAAAVLFLMAGCSEKFDIAAPYKNITVIYGYLEQSDTAHYIRIEKAFLDQNQSALVMAKVADSSFYSSINVRIERISFAFPNVVHDTIHLTKVDLTAEGYPKEPGVFFDAPSYAYKFKSLLDPGYIYRIKVINLLTGNVDSADAPVIQDNDPAIFHVDKVDDSSYNRAGMDFASTIPGKTFNFNGYYVPASDFSFGGQSTPVGYVQAIIRFNWADSDMLSGNKTPKYYDFNVGVPTVFASGQFTYNVDNNSLYSAVATGMGTAPAHTARLIGRCDLFVYLSTFDYNNYYQSNLTQGTGLTGSEVEPVYTNIRGANVLGLYTAKGVRRTTSANELTLTFNTVDSLIASPILSHANLVGTNYH